MRLALAISVTLASAHVVAAAPAADELPAPPAMPEPRTTGFVETDGARIFYAVHGTGNPVVLLHGGMGNGDHFGFQVPALAKTHQLIVIDTRGHGRSTLGKAKLSYKLFASDVVAVLDHLKLESAAIVGWSDGGITALQLAVHHPKRVTRIFTLGANYSLAGTQKSTKTSPTVAAYTARSKRAHAALARSKPAFARMLEAMRPVWRSQPGLSKDELRKLRVPAVIAVGEHDELIRVDHTEEMAKLIPGAKLVVFPKLSHFALWQDPAAFNAELLKFLAASE